MTTYDKQEDGGVTTGPMVYSRRSRSGEAHPVLFWFLMFLDAFILFAAIYYATLPMQHPDVISFHQQAVAVALVGAATAGGLVLIWRIREHDALQWVEKEYAAPAPPPMAEAFAAADKRELRIKTVRGEATIVQPRPGAFASWLAEVVNPDNRTSFSQNEAKRREWEGWMYTNLVAQLKQIGWLHPDRLINGAPDIDVQFREEIKQWLKTPLL